jgi:hypothetical protein
MDVLGAVVLLALVVALFIRDECDGTTGNSERKDRGT